MADSVVGLSRFLSQAAISLARSQPRVDVQSTGQGPGPRLALDPRRVRSVSISEAAAWRDLRKEVAERIQRHPIRHLDA